MGLLDRIRHLTRFACLGQPVRLRASVFLFPWATVFERLGMQAVVEMTIFVFILALGLLYAYRKKVLQWA